MEADDLDSLFNLPLSEQAVEELRELQEHLLVDYNADALDTCTAPHVLITAGPKPPSPLVSDPSHDFRQ